MAREQRLGSIAEEILEYGDTSKMASGDTHFEMLAAYEGMEQHEIREATQRFVQKKRLNRDRLATQLKSRAEARQAAVEENNDRLRVVELWRQAGIRERMTLRSIPKTAKWALWALIASLDFYIFAQVMAYAENIASPGLKDATFWLGGAVGLMVFIVGILLAQAIRRASYYYSQKKLLKELEKAEEPTTGLRLSPYSRWMTFGFGVFYIVFTAGAVVLRYQGGGKQQPGLLLLQTMIPIVGVMLELLIDDPTEVRLPQRTLRDWWLSRRLGKLDMSIALRELIARERESGVGDRYRFERAVLVNLHNDVGLKSHYAEHLAERAEKFKISVETIDDDSELGQVSDEPVALEQADLAGADSEGVNSAATETFTSADLGNAGSGESDLGESGLGQTDLGGTDMDETEIELDRQSVTASSVVPEG